MWLYINQWPAKLSPSKVDLTVEGLNNKAKVVKHRVYGYRSSHIYNTDFITAREAFKCLNFCTVLCDEPIAMIMHNLLFNLK